MGLIDETNSNLERDNDPELPDQPLQEPPPLRGPKRRGLRPIEMTTEDRQEYMTVDETRAQLIALARTHNPATVLVGALPPGCGKTTIGVQLAEQYAAAGQHVLYLGPRHDFFNDLLRIASRPSWWYEWLPRQEEDADTGRVHTCHHADQIRTWQERGYKSLDYCARICGWQYIKESCVYHSQKNRIQQYPIIFGQHQHLIAHPLLEHVNLVIVDESPLSAFLRHWIIPGRHIQPPDMAIDNPLTELMHELSSVANRGVHAEGPDLLSLLGGVDRVLELTEQSNIDVSSIAYAPKLKNADTEDVPYFHLPYTASLLLREAREAKAGREYPPRVALANGKMHLLLRHSINNQLQNTRIVCLDGTAHKHLYEAMFERPIEIFQPRIKLTGKIYQVWPRTNGKSSLIKDQGLTGKTEQLSQQVEQIVKRYGYERPGVITFEQLKGLFDVETGHFYGARGTNRFEGCDALIVAGTPQPDLGTITKTARMLYQERMRPFTAEWTEQDVPYAGQPFSYPVSGYWHDTDLHALLWQYREAEIIQAAHRARPAIHNVDIWLLTNIPIAELPPTELLDIKSLFDAPQGVDPYRWPDVVSMADEYEVLGKPLTAYDITTRLQIDKKTGQNYLRRLVELYPDRWEIAAIVPTSKGGKPAKALVPREVRGMM